MEMSGDCDDPEKNEEEEDQRNDRQPFGTGQRGTGEPAEPEQTGDGRDDEENENPLKHFGFSFLVSPLADR